LILIDDSYCLLDDFFSYDSNDKGDLLFFFMSFKLGVSYPLFSFFFPYTLEEELDFKCSSDSYPLIISTSSPSRRSNTGASQVYHLTLSFVK